MTIGFGAIAWNEEVGRIVAVAADSRLSHNGNTISDAGVKTYELVRKLHNGCGRERIACNNRR